MIHWPPKEPDEVADYHFDWSAMLQDGEAIASQAVTAEGVTVDDSAIADSGVTVWLSGGAQGTVGRVSCTIVTNSVPARTFTEIAVLPIGSMPVSLACGKKHLRVEHDEEDGLIQAYLRAAVSAVETATGHMLTPKVVRQLVKDFPSAAGGLIRLTRSPVQEVVAIQYRDQAGTLAALDDYRLIDGAEGALLPLLDESWPDAEEGPGAVVIDYLAGYAPGEAPAAFEQAVLVTLTSFYEDRGGGTALPRAALALIAPYRPLGIA